MLNNLIVILHTFLALGIIGLVLIQHGRGADAGAAFGSGASGTVFGARGSANFLSRATAVLATLFFATSLGMAALSGKQSAPQSVMEQSVVEEQPTAVVPADVPGADVQKPAESDVPSAK